MMTRLMAIEEVLNFKIITTKLLVKYIKHMIMGCNDDVVMVKKIVFK